MANNPYVNKVIYGNQTLIDLTGDTVTAADVASGVSFHDASGAAQTGSYVPVTPASVTPSNVNPAPLAANSPVTPTANGYAIESYASVTPSSAGAYFQSGICNMTTSGYAYDSQQGGTETTLWTNPNPDSSFNGNSQVYPSGDYLNIYKKIAFYFKASTSSTVISKAIYDTADIKKWNSFSGGIYLGSLAGLANSKRYSRIIQAYSNFFVFSYCYEQGKTGASTQYIIPTKITGIN